MDYGHKIADDELKKLEKRIAKEYERAYKEVRKKTDNYFKTFKKQDTQKAKDVKDGILSQKDYKDWRHNKMLTGKRWRDLSVSIADDYIHSTGVADYMIKEHSFDVYAKNFNFGTFEVEKGAKVDTMFTLYDKDTVERLIKDDPKLLPDPGKELRRKIKSGEVKRWELKQVQSVATQSIIQGESISGISRRIAKDLGERNLHSSVRTARTMTTCAENAGRVDSYKRAENLGIDLEQRWMATLDDRTRHTHAAMDGETQPVGGEFSNGCEYPGDPAGAPEEVYNCRCTLVADVKGTKFSEDFERRREDKTIGNMSYQEWKNQHVTVNTSTKIVNGKDITKTWKRRKDKFNFEIEDIINAQGFDGLPQVLSPKEFDKAVKAANNGEGFIAQRTYSAPSQEVLDEYRNQLYNGKWYVDCSTGGAQYGQGMYCAADYTGTLSKGIKEEMGHYKSLGEERLIEQHVDIGELSLHKTDLSSKMTTRWLNDEISGSELQAFQQKIHGMSDIEYAKKYMGIKIPTPVSYTETLTLHPSAKVVKYNDLFQEFTEYKSNISRFAEKSFAESLNESENFKTALLGSASHPDVPFKKAYSAHSKLTDIEKERLEKNLAEMRKFALKKEMEVADMNIGSFATLKGYDAINAVGHGQSGSYTVILNRTKLIIKGVK